MRKLFAIDCGKELFSNQLNSFFSIYSTDVLSREPQLLAYFAAGGATSDQFEISAGFSKPWLVAQFNRHPFYAVDQYVMKREASGE